MLHGLHPSIVNDKDMKPVAVQIPYEEWLQILAALEPAVTEPAHGGDLSRFVGSLHFEGDPVEWQRRIRGEWE